MKWIDGLREGETLLQFLQRNSKGNHIAKEIEETENKIGDLIFKANNALKKRQYEEFMAGVRRQQQHLSHLKKCKMTLDGDLTNINGD